MIRIELAQNTKMKKTEIQEIASRSGSSVEYCLLNDRPIAIMDSRKLVDGTRIIVKENISRQGNIESVCMGAGNLIRWTQFVFKKLNNNKRNIENFNVYRVV